MINRENGSEDLQVELRLLRISGDLYLLFLQPSREQLLGEILVRGKTEEIDGDGFAREFVVSNVAKARSKEVIKSRCSMLDRAVVPT